MSRNMPRFLLLIFIALSQFSSAFMHSIVGITLPDMGRELGASGVEMGLVESIFLGTAAALLLPIGRLADATDKNTLFKGGLLMLAIATFAIGFQPSMETIIGARFFQGAAAAVLTATGIAIVAQIAPPNQLGQMLGIAISATYIGLASGPFFSGLITTHLGWRWVFFLAAIPPLLSYFLARRTLRSHWQPLTNPVNLTNSGLLATSIIAIIAGAAMLKQTVTGLILTALGICLATLFVIVERRSSNPLLQIDDITANQVLSRALSAQFLIYCGTIGTTFLLSIYLQLIKGNTPETTGHILVLGPVVMAIFAPLAGRVADRVSPRRISAMGATSILCSVTLASLIDETTGVSLIIAIMVFQGLGFALFSAPNIALIMNSVDPTKHGMASARSAVMRSFGMVISMFIVTAFLSVHLGDIAIDESPADFLSAMRWSFLIFSILAALGIAQAVRPQRQKANTE